MCKHLSCYNSLAKSEWMSWSLTNEGEWSGAGVPARELVKERLGLTSQVQGNLPTHKHIHKHIQPKVYREGDWGKIEKKNRQKKGQTKTLKLAASRAYNTVRIWTGLKSQLDWSQMVLWANTHIYCSWLLFTTWHFHTHIYTVLYIMPLRIFWRGFRVVHLFPFT